MRTTAFSAAVLLSSFAVAQDGAESDDLAPVGESVVTARKWEERLLEVPGSVSLVGLEDLRTSGWDSLREAASTVPNLNLTEFSSRRLSFPFVRGVGSGQGDPSVITYVDGVPMFGSGGVNLPLDGVERIEFLRGPQGTLYGRNALGGVMHVITERPTDELSYRASAAFGDFDQQEFRAAASGPTTEGGPLWSFATSWVGREGFTDNDFTGNDVDDRNGFFGRGQLLFTPDDDSEVRVTIFGERARDGGFVLSDLAGLRDDPHTINQNFEGVANRDLCSPAVTWTRYGDGVDFVSISAFQHWEVTETSDFDFSPIDGVRRRTEEEQDYLYQELRLSSAEGRGVQVGDGELRWLAGASGFASQSDRSAANDFRPDGAGIFFPPAGVGKNTDSGEFDDWGLGLFGQVTYSPREDVDLTAGLRWDYESKEADLRTTFVTGGFTAVDVRTDEDADYDEVVPHLSAAYHLSDDAQVYALAAGGFKAGGFNLSAPAGLLEFEPETSMTYEVGARASFAEDKVSVGVAAFLIDWDDMQLSQFDATTGGYVQNVGESTSQGFELEAQAQVSEGLRVFSALGFADTEFDEFVDSFGSDVSGNELPFAPETTWNVGAVVSTTVADDTEVFLRGDYTLVGDFFYDPGNIEDESYGLTDLRAGVRRGALGLSVALRNAFDEEYVPVAFQPSPVDPTAFVGESGAPRTFLVTLSYDS